MTLGQRIRLIRGNASQDTFARKLHINKNTLGFYERDERTPNAVFIATICKQEGIATDWMLYGEGAIRSGPGAAAADRACPAGQDASILQALVRMVVEVLESDTIYRTALTSAIRVFHQAVRSGQGMERLERRMAVLERQMDALRHPQSVCRHKDKQDNDFSG